MSPWKQTKAGRVPTDERNQEICKALREGRTYASIAQHFEISIARVVAIRDYAGIELRRKPRTIKGKP